MLHRDLTIDSIQNPITLQHWNENNLLFSKSFLVFSKNNKLYSISFTEPNSREGPKNPPKHHGMPWTVPESRLKYLREEFMYWFFDTGGSNNIGDYQSDIHASNPQLHKNFNFQLPFFGFRYNYSRVN